MKQQKNRSEWIYAISPGFLARFKNGIYENRSLISGEWERELDPTFTKQVTMDATVIDEENVEKAFEALRKKMLDI